MCVKRVRKACLRILSEHVISVILHLLLIQLRKNAKNVLTVCMKTGSASIMVVDLQTGVYTSVVAY